MFQSLLPVAFFSGLAFWLRNPLLFILSFAVSIYSGLRWYDLDTSTYGLVTSLMLVAYSLYCFAMAVKYSFYREEE